MTNIPPETTEDQLNQVFSMHGDVKLLHLVKDTQDANRNRAYVKYTTKEQALIAIREVNGNLKLHHHPNPLEVLLAEQKRAMITMTNYGVKEDANEPIYYEYKTPEGIPYYFNPQTGQTQWEKPEGKIQEGVPLPVSGGQQQEIHQKDINIMNSQNNQGPEGASITIHNIPDDWTQYELVEHFKRFANILNSKIIQVDRVNGIPKHGKNNSL